MTGGYHGIPGSSSFLFPWAEPDLFPSRRTWLTRFLYAALGVEVEGWASQKKCGPVGRPGVTLFVIANGFTLMCYGKLPVSIRAARGDTCHWRSELDGCAHLEMMIDLLRGELDLFVASLVHENNPFACRRKLLDGGEPSLGLLALLALRHGENHKLGSARIVFHQSS